MLAGSEVTVSADISYEISSGEVGGSSPSRAARDPLGGRDTAPTVVGAVDVDAVRPGTPAGTSGADDGIRTRDPNLGKVVLYQLSHVRVRPLL